MNRIKNILIFKDLRFPETPDFTVENSELFCDGVVNHHSGFRVDDVQVWAWNFW